MFLTTMLTNMNHLLRLFELFLIVRLRLLFQAHGDLIAPTVTGSDRTLAGSNSWDDARM
jgi:hypothetical protein